MWTYRVVMKGTALLMVANLCNAQASRTSLAVNVGTATDVTGMSSSAVTIMPSFTSFGTSSTFSLAATGTRFNNRSWSTALNAGLTGRGAGERFAPTIDLGASAATTSQSFSYFSADALPALEVRVGSTRLFGGVRVRTATTHGATRLSPASPIFGAPPTTAPSAVTRSAATMVGGAIFTTATETGGSASVSYRGETGTVADRRQSEHVLSGSVGSTTMSLAGSLGQRAIGNANTMFGSAGLAVVVTPTISAQLAAGRDPENPMLGTPGGQFVNLGLAVRLGRSAPTLPRPSDVRAPQRDLTRLSIRAADARAVEVGGDFTQWQLVSTRRAANGVWYVDLAIPPGEYRYAFRIDGKEWRVPEGVAAADDEFGGKSAWLTVTRTPSQSGK
jgi:hypothetical protein